MAKCIFNRDWPNRGPTCAMGENMYYVYLEVNIVIIVYMDLEFGYMDIDGLLGRGFPHGKRVVVQFIYVITLEFFLHAHIWCTLCVCWFYHAIYSTGFITFSIRVFCTFKTSHLVIFVFQLSGPLFFWIKSLSISPFVD